MKITEDNSFEENAVTGVFRNRADAENAFNYLIGKGYSTDNIMLLMSDETHRTHFHTDKHDTDLGNKAMEKAGVGSAIGGTVGAIVAGIAAIGTTIALPGLGLVVAGPIVAGLTGAGAGGLAGGLIGGLVGAGIPKETAAVYHDSIKEGGIMLGVVPKTSIDRLEIASEWNNFHGENIHHGRDQRVSNLDINTH